MKHFSTILFFMTFSCCGWGQKIYRADKDAYKWNKFTYEFYLFNDSTCFLKGHNLDNSTYFIYKGQLKNTKDTLYKFIFQPVVIFGCNKRYHYPTDSVHFNINNSNNTDTTLSSLTYKIKVENGIEKTIEIKGQQTTVFIKGASSKKFSVDTKFIDPQTKKKIIVTVVSISDPDFIYYGAKTDFSSIIISIVKTKLTIYPDHKFIHDKDTFVLIK